MKSFVLWIAALLVGLVAYLSLWPVPVEPVNWVAPVAAGYAGPFAVNTRLAAIKRIDLKGEEGPEHIAFGKDGKLYTTVASGNILRMNADGSAQQIFANTGGRVLGFDFDAQGNLIAADAFKGLLSISQNGIISVLTDQVNGDRIRYADGVVVAKSGKIYFTDASTRFGPQEWGGTFEASVLDILEQASTGRLLEYDPATRATRILVQGFAFANGIALSQDEQSLFVNETGKYRIWRISVQAHDGTLAVASMPEIKLVFDNLPGYPDNLMRGLDGKIWVGLVKPRNATVDKLAMQPFLRKLTLRLPRALWPIPPAYGHVFAFTEDGRIVADLQDPSGAYPETSGLTETADRLYVQSLHAKFLGWVPKTGKP